MASIREYETREYLAWLEVCEAYKTNDLRLQLRADAEADLALGELKKAHARRRVMEDAKLSRAERRGRQSDR